MFRNVAISSLALALVACGNGNDAAETPQPVASDTGATTEAEASNTVAPASSAATPSAETNLPKADAELIEIYKQLHANPELSFKEAKSAALMASELENLGFDVSTGIGQDWVVAKAMKDVGEVKDGVGGHGVVGVLHNGDGPTVIDPHAWSIGIKNADDLGVDPMCPVIGHCDGFGKSFGFVIDTTGANGVHVSPIVFWLRMNQGISINFRGGGKKKNRLFCFCQAQGIMSSQCADFKGLNGKLQIVNGAGRGCEMKNIIQFAFQVDKLRNVVFHKLKLFTFYVGDIILGASDKIIHADHFMAFIQKVFA